MTRVRAGSMMVRMSTVGDWMERNLATQGYCLGAAERRDLRVGLRFSTALCLPVVVTALAVESPPLLLGLASVGVVAGFTPRHPFDLVWNHGVRHLFGAPVLPPNPARRRHAFKIGSAWLVTVAALFGAGLSTAALALGGMLVAACVLVSAVNFCMPSYLLSLLERRRTRSITQAAG